MQFVSQIGGSVTNGLAYVGSLASLGGRAAYYTFVGPFQGKPLRLQRAVSVSYTHLQRLAESFANERTGLEKQWDRSDNVSTEDLRVALQRYRSFFDRLLKL